MKKRIALFAPGPTNLSKVVLESFQKELIHHRGKQFRELYPALCDKLKNIFKTTTGETLVLTGSGTLGLDAGIASLFNTGDKVLIPSNGYFGERLQMMAQKYGLEVIALKYEWTKSFNIKEIEQVCSLHPDLKGLLVVYSETSTGNLQDLPALGLITKQKDLLFMVDAISGLLFNDFAFDAWHIDYAVSSSQKGFGLPPGLAFVCMSQKSLQRLKKDHLNYYISLQDNLDFKHNFGTTPSTPAIHMMQALEGALDEILVKGINAYKQRGQQLVTIIKQRLVPLGFIPLISLEDQAFGVLGLYVPKSIKSGDLQDYLVAHKQVYIEKGIAALQHTMIRIGLMSDVSDEEVEDMLVGIEEYMHGIHHQG